jgi:lipid A disaccharide synthetase
MIVMYDAGRLLALPYRLFGRFVLKSPHLSLANILAGARVVPEFMPFIADVAPVADVARQLLEDDGWRRLMTSQLDDVVRPLEATEASTSVSRIMRGMLANA